MSSPNRSQTKTEDNLLKARLTDAAALCEARRKPCFVGFLDERQRAFAQNLMKQLVFQNYMLWGGYADSERVVFGAFPEYMEPERQAFPIAAFTASFRPCDVLTHRDFLGAVLSHGLERNMVGDILVEEGRGILFVREEIGAYLLSQVERIGRVGISLKAGWQGPLPVGRQLEEIAAVVASLRLDCVVAACLPCSRDKASALIQTGLVMRNHERELSPSAMVAEGDKLSIRGKGRFLLETVGAATKKGRLHIFVKKSV